MIRLAFLLGMVTVGGATQNAVPGSAEPSRESRQDPAFWAPVLPPRAHYEIRCEVDPTRGILQGTQVVSFTNTSSKRIQRLAFDWAPSDEQKLSLRIEGKNVALLAEGGEPPSASPVFFDLPTPVLPGERVVLDAQFTYALPGKRPVEKATLTEWYPRLWWGFPTVADYDVWIDVPAEYALGTSGRQNPASKAYRVRGAQMFGLFLGKGMHIAEADISGVQVRTVFTPLGEDCADLLRATAVDAIRFYHEWLGFFPYESLTIVPGGDLPWGGYPVAAALVAIHGQERMPDVPEIHWRWITAHEIGHQYFGEYVLQKDYADWLWIGLGIYADREYIRARSLSLEKHRELMERYVKGVRNHLDTTMIRTPEQYADIDFDFNNVVTHGKGFSVISALACLQGREVFDRAYARCLKEFGGRRLGLSDFQTIVEVESQQDLGWFFNQWVRSNRYLSYAVTSQECSAREGKYVSQARIECQGTLKMPVPVAAYFADGTRQMVFTNRAWDFEEVQFESTAPLTEVRLDPDGELAMVVPPPPLTEKDLQRQIDELPWRAAGRPLLRLFKVCKELNPKLPDLWGKIGLLAYDGNYLPEALEAFTRATEVSDAESVWSFSAQVWRGHILDILGRRADALEAYNLALQKENGRAARHDQYDMRIDRKWVEQRLETPFSGKGSK